MKNRTLTVPVKLDIQSGDNADLIAALRENTEAITRLADLMDPAPTPEFDMLIVGTNPDGSPTILMRKRES